MEVREIDKMGRKAVDSNMLFIDGLRIPAADRIGEEGRGFEYILHGLNPERILIAAEAVGIGRAALTRAVRYAGERTVFGRPIGQNQGVQHPWPRPGCSWKPPTSWSSRRRPCTTRDSPAAPYANSAKYLAAEAGHNACQTAVMTLGGMGYAKEYHVERLAARKLHPPHRPRQPAADPVLHRGKSAGTSQILLKERPTPKRCALPSRGEAGSAADRVWVRRFHASWGVERDGH